MAKWLGVVTLTLLLSGCGFHLRGNAELPKPLQRIYLNNANPFSDFNKALRIELAQRNTVLVDNPNQANYSLKIIDVRYKPFVLGGYTPSQTQQMTLRYSLTYALLNAKGMVVFGPKHIQVTRAFAQNDSIIQSSNQEQAQLKAAMRTELIDSLIFQLRSQSVWRLLNKSSQR